MGVFSVKEFVLVHCPSVKEWVRAYFLLSRSLYRYTVLLSRSGYVHIFFCQGMSFCTLHSVKE
jgi:hypothetical protein